jgi:hypothetical protein
VLHNYNDFFLQFQAYFYDSQNKQNLKESNQVPENLTDQNWLTQPQ